MIVHEKRQITQNNSYRVLKRLLDIIVAFILLILLFPIIVDVPLFLPLLFSPYWVLY